MRRCSGAHRECGAESAGRGRVRALGTVQIQQERFASLREGARLFGVFDLAFEDTEEFCAAMVIRAANDRSTALEIAVGVKVFVCDNLCFSGDLIALRRKHTARFNLNADIGIAMDLYQEQLTALRGQIAGLSARRCITPRWGWRGPRLAALKAKRHGDRFADFKAVDGLAAKLLRVIWGVWRSGPPYDPRRTGGLRRQSR